MGLFNTILNKFRFYDVKSIDSRQLLSVGYYRDITQGIALLHDGKKVGDNLLWVSENLKNDSYHSQSDYVYAEALIGYNLLLFNKHGECLTPTGLKIYNSKSLVPDNQQEPYGIDDEYGDIIVTNPENKDKFIITPHRKYISSTYKEISNYNDNEQRRVKFLNTFYAYVDKNGKPVSGLFLHENEEDLNGNRIQTVINSLGDKVQVIVDKNHKQISKFYDSIYLYGRTYIAQPHKGPKVQLDHTGKPLYTLSNQTCKKIEIENQPNGMHTITFPNQKKVDKISNINYNDELGILLGIVGEKSCLYGLDGVESPINYNLAQIIQEYYRGKELSKDKIYLATLYLEPLKKTIKAFNKIIDANLQIEPTNIKLMEAQIKTEQKLKKILKSGTTKEECQNALNLEK